ncbi:MAG: hypothetical protein OEW90_12725, partial [Betaproteobacteria bacterium]|nr:hypothetical protein [Betaproteobacteria bacterium]
VCVGERARLGGVDLDEGVQLAVELLDAREVRGDDVAARAAAAAQLLGLLEQREVSEFDGGSPRSTAACSPWRASAVNARSRRVIDAPGAPPIMRPWPWTS